MRGIPDEQIRITVDCPEAAAASWPSRAQEPIARHVRRPDEHRSVGAARWAGVVRDRPSPSQNAMHLGLPTFSKVPPDSPEGWPGVRHSASGARSVRQFVGIMIVSHSAFTGGASHGGARPDQRPRGNLRHRGPARRGRHPVSGHRPQHERPSRARSSRSR